MTDSPDKTEAMIAAAIEEQTVNWHMLLRLSRWRTLSAKDKSEWRSLGERYYLRAVESFQAQRHGAEVAMFPPVGGVYLSNDGELRISVESAGISFDWSDARRLIFEIDELAEKAKEWWQARPSRGDESAGAEMERRPHSLRAYALATWVVGAIKQENAAHTDASAGAPAKPSEMFERKLANFRADLVAAQDRFRQGAQRSAQSRYWRGTLIGAVILAAVCLVVGAIFWWRGVDAAYGVVLPAGGIGAMVSVLQRMSSGGLVLDFEAGRDLLEVFGGVRPFIGAIFGLAVMALLAGGLIPAIEIPADQELAFFAAVGFLAGFNERWAQDMLKGSADHLSNGPQGPGAEAAPAPRA